MSELPSDFLRPDGEALRQQAGSGGTTQEELDRQAALALQRHYNSRRQVPATQTAAGRLNLTIAQVSGQGGCEG